VICMKLSRSQAGLIFLLFVLLLAGTASALPDEDHTLLRDPPPQQAGERIPVFLVLNEQPQQFSSFGQLKADALGRQAQVLQTVRAVDTTAFETAQSYWIANAIRVEADPAALNRLAAIPGVSRIEPDLTVTLNDPAAEVASTISPDYIRQPDNEYATVWSADFIEAPSVWKSGNTGEGVTIAVIDTGIDGSHPAFGDRVVAFADFVGGQNETPYDDDGHGTHCAGTAAGGTVTVKTYRGNLNVTLGVAPGADLMGVKVLDGAGNGQFSTVLDGVQWAVENDADVISMSLGGYEISPNSTEDINLAGGASYTVELEVSSELLGDPTGLYEPQFVVGEVRVETYAYARATDYYGSTDPLENLTITVTDNLGNVASGKVVDWLGFDQEANRYCFKAPYASNANGWNGIWKISVTNTGETDVRIEKIALTECYQSRGETVIDTAINNVVAGGTVVAVAAGNDGQYGTSTIGTPGTAKDAITVGATDYLMDYRASFSSMGPVNRVAPYVKPDVMAPGVGVISAYPYEQYASMQGTSMSCPAVAGAAALMLSGNSTLTPADVKAALMETAVHIGKDGTPLQAMLPNNAYGAGRINAYEAVNTTGGLGGTNPSDGILRELIGGTLSSYSIMGDTLPVMAVLWNTTAGEPMAEEDVDIKVWYDDYYNYQYHPVYIVNQTLPTDVDGHVYYPANISGVPDSRTVYTQISYGDLWVRDSVSKQSLTPTPTPEPVVVPIFDDVSYRAEPNATVLIKYPLLAADGSPYAEDVNFTVGNRTKNFVNETIAPVDGVIAYSLDLAEMPPDETGLYIRIDGRTAGYISVGGEGYHSQEVIPFPERAICPPGESVDLGFMAWSHHGQKTVSQDIGVHVTTLTETQVLSLSSAGSLALSDRGEGDMQALLAEIDAMKPETYTTTVQVRNGIGLLNFTMPDDGYIAVVRFVSLNGYEATVLVYGTLDPWLMQRSTPRTVDEYHGDDTWLYSISEWPSTWDQDAYASVPAGEATITAYVYTYSPTTDEWDNPSGRPVYLYTENGVETKTTDADGACTFIVSTAGKERLDYLLVTDGLSQMDWIYTGYCPLYPISQSSVRPGMIGTNLVAPVDIGMLYPKIERRSATINPVTDGDYDVTVRSYGPDNKPIQEMGYFRFDRISEESIWDLAETELAGTEAAAVVNFSGTETRRVTPATGGYYQAWYGLLDPKSGEIGNYVSATLRNPERFVSYTLEGTVTAETSVPVVFNVSTKDGTPVEGARVVLALGEAAGDGWGSEWYYSPHYNDPRDGNIRLAADWYPDPYTVIATGYTDASGKVTLTFTAPTAGQQALRESLAHAWAIPYRVLCYHDGDLLQEDYGRLAVTTERLPDFVPEVSAPHIVKLEKDDTITISNVALRIKNIGTADYVYDGVNTMTCTAEVGPHSQPAYFKENLAVGETKSVISGISLELTAKQFDIDPNDYRLPLDVNVGVTVNANKAVKELNYQNNRLMHPVRITAPDLAAEVVAPRYTTPTSETAIGVRVTNLGEVGSNEATLTYRITGKTEGPGITIPALKPGESTVIWRNETALGAREYTVSAEVNPRGVSDYETTFTNNGATATILSSKDAVTRIELPQDLVMVPNTTYDLPIIVYGVEKLAAYNIDLTFNGSVLEVEKVIPGPLGIFAQNIENGRVRCEGVKTSGVSGNVTIATVRFKVTGTTGDGTPLNLAAGLTDANGLTIPVGVVSGNAYLLLLGDANGDGAVNQRDTLKVLRLVVGLDTPKPVAGTPAFLVTDINRNGVIDVGDAMFIAQHNVGLRDAYFRLK